jgi:hypothetical protein
LRRNFDLSTGLLAIGAAVVLVSLFLRWYDPDLSAWDAFEVVDWAVAALAAGTLALLVRELSAGLGAGDRLIWIAGVITLLVAAQVIDPPPAAHQASRESGIWLALGGSLAMLAGATLRLMHISVTIGVAERERRRRTPAVDSRGGGPAANGGEGAQGSGGLWQAPAAERRAEPAAAPAPPAPPAPVDDPDRTQPLPRVEPPDEVR